MRILDVERNFVATAQVFVGSPHRAILVVNREARRIGQAEGLIENLQRTTGVVRPRRLQRAIIAPDDDRDRLAGSSALDARAKRHLVHPVGVADLDRAQADRRR